MTEDRLFQQSVGYGWRRMVGRTVGYGRQWLVGQSAGCLLDRTMSAKDVCLYNHNDGMT